jgi:hypothetical protein
MLPISAEKIPTSSAELADALTRGLQKHNVTPRGIEARGSFPAIEALSVDLSGSQLTRDLRPPGALDSSGSALEIGALELVGAPVNIEQAALEVRLSAQGVKARIQLGEPDGWLVVDSAAAGTLSVQIARETLEAVVHALAVGAAAKQGVEVRKTKLTFTQEGPRAVSFRAEATAKVFVMSATLALAGRLDIDDELNARVSQLKLDGERMILSIAGNFARPHLDRLEGRVFSLRDFTPGGLKLRDVELTAGDVLQVRAQFGAA